MRKVMLSYYVIMVSKFNNAISYATFSSKSTQFFWVKELCTQTFSASPIDFAMAAPPPAKDPKAPNPANMGSSVVFFIFINAPCPILIFSSPQLPFGYTLRHT
ncbi:hypothetical protein L9F63_028360, partial [Diploptera punctata]